MRKIMGNHWTQENEWDTGPRIVIKDANYCECQYLIAMKWCMGRCLMRRQVGSAISQQTAQTSWGPVFFWGDQYPNNLHRNARVQIFSIQSRRAHVPLGCGAQDPEEASGRKSARHRGFSSWEASKEVLCGPDRSQMIFTDSQAIPVLVDQVRVQQAACQCNIDDQTVSARWCPKLLVKVVYPLVN